MSDQSRKRVFVVYPFRQEFRPVYDLIVSAILAAGAEAVRSDLFSSLSEPIPQTIERMIRGVDLVIADVTGSNPNVSYEIGIARGLKKPLILVAQATESIPFDLRSERVVFYDLKTVALSGNVRLDSGVTLGEVIGSGEFARLLEWAIRQAIENPEQFEAKTQAMRAAGTVFISYSHNDTAFLRRLLVHLRPLERDGRIELFVDTKLKAGDKWKDRITQALSEARVAILILSADFLASDFIIDNELPPLLQRAEANGTRIVPLIVKPCRFTRDRNLSTFQAINDPSAPLVNLAEGPQEEIYDRIARLVEESVSS